MEKGGLKEFQKKLKTLTDYIALATVPASSYNKTNLQIIKNLTEEQKTPGVYVTLNKPYSTMVENFKKNKIDNRMIIFVDCVTKLSDSDLKKTKGCLYIGSPEKLSDISIAMDQAVRAIPTNEKFVFFDSLSTLLMYNKSETVAKFIHFLATKMRIWKVKGIIISLEKENKELIDKLTQVCDIVQEIGD